MAFGSAAAYMAQKYLSNSGKLDSWMGGMHNQIGKIKMSGMRGIPGGIDNEPTEGKGVDLSSYLAEDY